MSLACKELSNQKQVGMHALPVMKPGHDVYCFNLRAARSTKGLNPRQTVCVLKVIIGLMTRTIRDVENVIRANTKISLVTKRN